MAIVVPNKSFTLAASADPKKDILNLLRDALPKIHVQANEVLVATYMRPEMTKGGILRPDVNKEEDVWQGKVGLIVKLGTEAFVDGHDYKFADADRRQVGDWVLYKPNESWPLNICGVPCRQMRDTNIRQKLDDPDLIY